MDSLHEQVAVLQQKIDYLIDQMATLTGDPQQAPAFVLRSPLGRKPAAASETDRSAGPKNEIGLNRYRALRAKG